MTIIDASNYFKGLLLLARKDKKTTQSEIDLVRRVGRTLGFEREFCDNAIEEIHENRFIVDEPPGFSTRELAAKFIRDGLAFAFADRELDQRELQWLLSVAVKNGLDEEWFSMQLESAKLNMGFPDHLEVDNLKIERSSGI